MNWELPDVQGGFKKDWENRDQIGNISWITEKKQDNSKITSTFASWPDADFLGGRSGGLIFLSLSEFSTVCCDPQSQSL